MKGLIDINSFEEFFDEKTLKRGLSLYERNKIGSVDKLAGGEYIFRFKIKEEEELTFRKKGNRVIEYNCSCGRVECEHLCAAIFYLEKDKLLTSKIKRESKKRSAERIEFEKYCAKLERLIKRYPTNKISETIVLFELQNKTIQPVLRNLVVLNVLIDHLAGNHEVRTEFRNILHKLKPEKLSQVNKDLLYLICKRSLKNNSVFNSFAFSLLIPVTAFVSKNKQELAELRSLLDKRKLGRMHKYYLDKQLIARFIIQIREAELSDKALNQELTCELSVAKAELKLSAYKNSQAIAGLMKDHSILKEEKPAGLLNYLEEVIHIAGMVSNNEAQLFFLKELMLVDSIIPVNYLKLYKELLPVNEREKEIDKLISDIKRNRPELCFDKLVQILESENRHDELLKEISKHSDKFFLAIRIALKKLPDFDNFTLNIVAQQFVNVLYEAREIYHQKEIFEKTKIYFEGLPPTVVLKVVNQILEKIGRNNFVYELLKKYAEKLELNLQA